MRKSIGYAAILGIAMIALIYFLSSDLFPGKEGDLVDEQQIDENLEPTEQPIASLPEVSNHPETKEIALEIEGVQQTVEMTRFSDELNTYVIYVDESLFTVEDGLSQTITAKESPLITLTIESVPDQTPQQVARTRAEQYRQDFSVKAPVEVTDPLGSLHLEGSSETEELDVYLLMNPMQDATFLLTLRYPEGAEENYAPRLQAMVASFQMKDTRETE